MNSLIYNAGTVSVSGGSAIVEGNLTGWVVALVEGGVFSCDGLSIPILSVEDDTHLTLAYAWPGANGSGKEYAIARTPSEATARAATWTVDRLGKLAQTPWGVGVVPDGRGTLAQRDALNPMPNDDYCWLRVEVDEPAELYFRDGGQWLGPYPFRGEPGAPGLGAGGYGLPLGGAVGNILGKSGAGAGAASWLDAPSARSAIGLGTTSAVGFASAVLSGSAANRLRLVRTGAAANSIMEFATDSGSVFAGLGASGRFAIKGDVNIAASPWLAVDPIDGLIVNNRKLVERGSNANGEFVRWADGTQICWRANFTAVRTNPARITETWTFPAAFSATIIPLVTMPYFNNQYIDCTVEEVGNVSAGSGTTSAIIGLRKVASAPDWPTTALVNSIGVCAVGRWFN